VPEGEVLQAAADLVRAVLGGVSHGSFLMSECCRAGASPFQGETHTLAPGLAIVRPQSATVLDMQVKAWFRAATVTLSVETTVAVLYLLVRKSAWPARLVIERHH